MQFFFTKKGNTDEDPCAAFVCVTNSVSTEEIDWIQCETCKTWVHTVCVGVEPDQNEFYYCYPCE